MSLYEHYYQVIEIRPYQSGDVGSMFTAYMNPFFVRPNIADALGELKGRAKVVYDWIIANGLVATIKVRSCAEHRKNGQGFWTEYYLVARWPEKVKAVKKAA